MADDTSQSASNSAATQPHHQDLDEMKLFAASSAANVSTNPGTPSNSSSSRRVVVVGNNGEDDDMDDDMDDEHSNGSRGDDAGVASVIDSVIGRGADGNLDDDGGGGGPDEPSFNLRLIEAVRQSRCLYDASDRQYRSADHKIKVWNRLVHLLAFHGDARTLYNRWKQLRDKYGKEKKKMKYSGDVSQWQLFKHLEFLDPHMIDRTQQKYERNKDGKLVYKETNPPIIISDPNFALHLINEVRLQPCLFDIKDAKYRHTEFRNQAWAEIIKSLNFPGDINGIYKQWKKIRDRYVREKRKLRMSANGEHEEPTWELFRELIWIDPFLDERAAQVKRKRESSEMSDDFYLDDSFNLNSSGSSRAAALPVHQPSPHQQQLYSMVQTNQASQQQQHVQHLSGTPSTSGAKMQLHSVLPNTSNNQGPIRQLRTTNLNASNISASPATAILASNGTTLMMQPTVGSLLAGPSSLHPQHHQLQPQQHLPLSQHHQIHHQVGIPAPGQPQQHVIITNEPLDGDRAFALSVAADLSALPEHARNMARAQIQHLLENSKITIVKA